MTDQTTDQTLANRDQAVKQICHLHGEIKTFARSSLDKAIQIGRLLSEQKGKLPHGRWEDFVMSELPFTIRTASNYMRVYRRSRSETVSDLSLTDTYKLLTEPKSPTGPEQAPSPEPPRVAHTEPDNAPTPIRYEPGINSMKPVTIDEDADKDSNALFNLKRWWKKGSKKDHKEFLRWVEAASAPAAAAR